MRRLIPFRFCLSLVALAAIVVHAAPSTQAGSGDARTDETRALWVVRDSLANPAAIEEFVSRAVANGFNTLLVQVRGRGDAYFNGGLEPRATALAGQPASFDPMATTLRIAHAAGLKVHAWVSVNLVSSAVLLPSSRDHIVTRHPEWLMVPRPLAQELAAMPPQSPGYVGKLARWTRGENDRVEGLYLSPVVPAAAAYTVAVIEDLVRRYDVDGVHLDYVRYPGAEFDHSRLALEEFARAVAPTLASPERHRLTRKSTEDVLAWVDNDPQGWADFRRSRLTALVMRLRTTIRAVRPAAVVSAAVVPEADLAASTRLQDWQVWASSGLLDVVCPMAYTTDERVFRAQIEEAVRLVPSALVWAGIGAYKLSPAQAVAHIGMARAAGASGIALFSYDAIASRASDGYLDTVHRTAFTPAATGQGNQR